MKAIVEPLRQIVIRNYIPTAFKIKCLSYDLPWWTKDHQALPNDVEVHTWGIVKNHPKSKDSGLYTCMGNFRNGTTFNISAEVIVSCKCFLFCFSSHLCAVFVCNGLPHI